MFKFIQNLVPRDDNGQVKRATPIRELRFKFCEIFSAAQNCTEKKQEKAIRTRLPWFTRSTNTNECYATLALPFFSSAILTDLNLFFFLFSPCVLGHDQMSLVQPSGEMSAKIREELREPDAETIAKDVAAIREWLEKQPHLPKDMGE